jgi:hypothetical protein
MTKARSGRDAALWFFVFLVPAVWLFTIGPYAKQHRLSGVQCGIPFEVSGYRGDEFRTAVLEMQDDVRTAYLQTQLWDLLVNGLLLTVAATKISLWVASRAAGKHSFLRNLGYFPLVLGLTDILENLLMLSVLVSAPPSLLLAQLAAAVTSIKLALVPTLVLIPIGVVAIWVWRFVPDQTN